MKYFIAVRHKDKIKNKIYWVAIYDKDRIFDNYYIYDFKDIFTKILKHLMTEEDFNSIYELYELRVKH